MCQSGFTYLEMMIVVVILGIAASMAMPVISSSDPKRLDVATKEIAAAIGFARSEAIRTKITYGVDIDSTNERFRVYSRPAATVVYNVYHPLDKKLYDIQLTTHSQTAGAELTSANFTFSNGANGSLLDFNGDGIPKYTTTADYMLTSGAITVSYRGQQRTISIAPMTGRVTIQ